MMDLYNLIDLIKYPVITEKSTKLFEKNQYTFIFDKKAKKPEIKKLIEVLFSVQVKKVNTQILPLKYKRIGLKQGSKPQYKKVIIQLDKDSKIDIFGN